jgi:hypothetical protein
MGAAASNREARQSRTPLERPPLQGPLLFPDEHRCVAHTRGEGPGARSLAARQACAARSGLLTPSIRTGSPRWAASSLATSTRISAWTGKLQDRCSIASAHWCRAAGGDEPATARDICPMKERVAFPPKRDVFHSRRRYGAA